MANAPLLFIMPLAGGNVDILFIKGIDKPILLRDAAAPIPAEIMAQSFGLPDALMPVALDIRQQLVDSPRDLAILTHPRHEVLPRIF